MMALINWILAFIIISIAALFFLTVVFAYWATSTTFTGCQTIEKKKYE
jgi:membrane protein insertase Oxa1/YidC/SpoIIIJ